MNKSSLFDEKSFYTAFSKDLFTAKSEIIIESPFITKERAYSLMPAMFKSLERGVKVFIVTRSPKEHIINLEQQSEEIIRQFEKLGVQVFLCIGNHHRKLAIIDRKIIWEGSLNILSQSKSREIMRRIDDKYLALELFNFVNLNKIINQ